VVAEQGVVGALFSNNPSVLSNTRARAAEAINAGPGLDVDRLRRCPIAGDGDRRLPGDVAT
ncbi:MAG TPA: hypothetical protein VLC08_00215, partial [Chitinolyticbacter sp.]|nr:hypothetical protein [Chitinolyticbacter sp.]